MSKAPTFDDVFDVMSAASVGDLTARVIVPADAPLDDTTTTFALALNILLDDLAVSASRARAELTERERLALRVQALVDASQEFAASTGDIDQLLDIVARRLGELVGDMCAIRQLSADGEWLESGGAIYHKRPEMLEAARALSLSGRQRVGEGISGRVAASGKPFIAARVSSAITIPLVCRGRVVGIANLLRGSDSPPYDDNDLQSVQSVADHAALAIDNALSYAAERTARAAAEEATRAMREAQARFSRPSHARQERLCRHGSAQRRRRATSIRTLRRHDPSPSLGRRHAADERTRARKTPLTDAARYESTLHVRVHR